MAFDVKPIVSPKPTDCGATCMKMLLDYYGIDVDLDTLIKECRTNIIGCTGADLLRVGRKYGLEMKAYREIGADDDILPEAKVINVPTLGEDRPAIIWWKFNHWCVLCGKDEDGKVVVCNPDRGRLRMSEGVFWAFYTDVSLTNGEPEVLKKGENNDED